MARDGLLPALFGRVHPTFRTPHLSTMFTGAIVALVAAVTPIEKLGQLVSIGTLLAFVLVCIGLVLLRRTSPELHRPFRAPAVPLVPILGALICLAQMASLPGETWARLVVWLAVGFVIYFGYSRRSAETVRLRRARGA